MKQEYLRGYLDGLLAAQRVAQHLLDDWEAECQNSDEQDAGWLDVALDGLVEVLCKLEGMAHAASTSPRAKSAHAAAKARILQFYPRAWRAGK